MCDSNIPVILLGVGMGGRLLATVENWFACDTGCQVSLKCTPVYASAPLWAEEAGGEVSACSGKTPFSSESPPPPPSNGPLAMWGPSLPSASACLVGQLRAVPAFEYFLFFSPRSKIWGCGPCPALSMLYLSLDALPKTCGCWRAGGGGVCSSG